MQIADTNVLLYAVDEESPHHEAARAWLDGAFGRQSTVAFAWTVLLAFLRVSTMAGVFPNPLSVDQAAEIVDRWLGEPAATILEPTPRHLALVRGLLGEVGTAGNLVGDAHLAALAVEHRAEVVSFDRDFGRFEGVRWRIPE